MKNSNAAQQFQKLHMIGTLCLQDLLNDPNPNSPAQSDAYMLFTQKPAEYKRRVRAQTSAHPPPA